MDVYTVENITYKNGQVIHRFKDSKTNPHGSTNCEYKLVIEHDVDRYCSNFRTDIVPLQPMYVDTFKPRYTATPKTRYKGHIELPTPPAYELVELDSKSYSIIDAIAKSVEETCIQKGLIPWYSGWTYTKNTAKEIFKLVTKDEYKRLTELAREGRLKDLEHEDN